MRLLRWLMVNTLRNAAVQSNIHTRTGEPSTRQVWVCLQELPPPWLQSASPQVPATLSALAQPSALGSPAALLPGAHQAPSCPRGFARACISPLHPDPGTAHSSIRGFCHPHWTKQRHLPASLLFLFFFFFFLTSASRPYATVLICFDVPSHQDAQPSEEAGVVCV